MVAAVPSMRGWMSAPGSRQATGRDLVTDCLRRVFDSGFHVRIHHPPAVDDYSEPEPDVAVVTGTIRDYRDAHPTLAVLVVEVSDESLHHDRTVKRRLYARCGIPEYWILALPDARLEVYRDPVEGGYRSVTKHAAGDSVAPLARPDALHVWLAADRSLKCGINPFEIRVAENGDTWIERLLWVRRTSTPSGPKLERPGVTPSTLTRDRD